MPVLTATLLRGPISSVNSFLSTAERNSQRGAAKTDSFPGAEDEPQDYYLCPVEDIGLLLACAKGTTRNVSSSKEPKTSKETFCLTSLFPPFLPYAINKVLTAGR